MTGAGAIRLDDPLLVASEYATEERLARRAAAFTHADPGVPELRARVVEEIRALGARRVLEVGCGWGELSERIAAVTDAHVVALDVSPRMVELARARGVDAGVGDVQSLPFDDRSFDVGVAAWMLYHVADLDRGVGQLARVLRPGGRLLAITNSAAHLEELRALVGSGPSPSRFTRENGKEILARSFAHVRREDADGTVVFATRSDVLQYVQASIAMSPFVQNLPAMIAVPYRARRAASLFIAEKAG
jgi:ubiquinone/menaquinone biosynthesis C-methylase UbiE